MYKSLIFTSAMLLSMIHVKGQEHEVLKDTLVQSLIITHSKTPISLKSAYKPTIVISEEEILSHPSDDIATLLDRQLGLTVNSSLSNPGKDRSVFLQGASGEFTLVLIDGIPLTDPSGIGGTFDLRSMSLSQLKRIEVVKGGQSVLYGSDAIAGVINLITTDSNSDQLSGNVKAAYGSYNSRDINTNLQLPLGSRLRFNVSGAYAGSSGISEALDENMAGFDNDGFNKNALQGSLIFTPTNGFRIRPFARYSSFNGDYDGGAFTDGTDTYETDWLQTGISSSYNTKGLDLSLSYTFNKTDRTFNSAFGVFDFKGRFNNLDVYGQTQLSDKVSMLMGINHQSLSMIDPNSAVIDPDATVFSPYASFSYNPDQLTHLEAGIRYNSHSTYGSNTNSSFGASRWISDKIKASAYFATSFKAPNLFQLFGQFGANPDLQPQRGRSINIGFSAVEIGLFDEITLGLFDRSVDDLIIFDFATGYTNIPRQHDQGIELGVGWKSGPLKLSASYAYLFGELDDKTGVNEPVENLIRRPKHQIDAAVSYFYQAQSMVQFTLRYSGNRDDIYFDNNTFLNEAVVLESYLLGDLYVNYTMNNSGVTIFAEVKNLFDTEFAEVAGFSTLGRNYRFGVSLGF